MIIPNLESPLIGEVIAALGAQSAYPQIGEIIVVGVARKHPVPGAPLVRHIDTGRPTPAARARNLGAAAASGEHLLFVDADCILTPHALERLLAAVQPGIGAVCGGVIPERGSYWQLAANLMAFPEFLSVDRPGERPCLPSFCLLVPRAVWEHVGVFDERFPGAAGEDLDLSFRQRRAGYRLWCEPAASVYHRPARTTIGVVWRRHAAFGPSWRHLFRVYPDILPTSPAIWACDTLGDAAPAALVPLAALFVLRLALRRPHLLRYWHALPGMAWAQLALYYGAMLAVRWSIHLPDAPSEAALPATGQRLTQP